MKYKTKKQRIIDAIDNMLEAVPTINRDQINLQLLRSVGAIPAQIDDVLVIMERAGVIESDSDNIYKVRHGERLSDKKEEEQQ